MKTIQELIEMVDGGQLQSVCEYVIANGSRDDQSSAAIVSTALIDAMVKAGKGLDYSDPLDALLWDAMGYVYANPLTPEQLKKINRDEDTDAVDDANWV
jgi:hypothetical protein